MTRDVLEVINTRRYPLDGSNPDALAQIIAAARVSLAEVGYAELPGFIAGPSLDALVADAESLAPRAHRSSGPGTAYLELPDEERFEEHHPRRRWMPYEVGAVAYDLMPLDSPLRRIYETEVLRAFLEAVLGRGELHRYADPFGALNLAVMGEGDELQWHFDQTDFVVSLAIQSSDQGGEFEVVPHLRTQDDEHYDRVAAVLDGTADAIVTLPMTPGTLLIFEGRNSLHRVTPIEGQRLRYVGLLAYDTGAETESSQLLRLVRYGRTEPFEIPPTEWVAS
ncbi:MAG: 2OG-Fe(II) oxygenase [Actinomycetes bacterium]